MKARVLLKEVIDLRGGAYGASFLATLVWIMNMVSTSPPDMLGSTTAAAKQWAYTFLVGGILFRFVTRFALRPGNAALAVALATFLPGSLGCLLTYCVHSLKGTPSPFLSTLPTILFTFIIVPPLALLIRRKKLKPAPLAPQCH